MNDVVSWLSPTHSAHVIRKLTRNRKIYPNEESALKLVFMAICEAAKKWTMPIHHWNLACK